MKKTFSEIWQETKRTMHGHWGKSILCCLFVSAVELILSLLLPENLDALISLLLFPLNAGLMLYFLRLSRQQEPHFNTLFELFNHYGRWLWGAVRIFIFVFLWTLLLIIPGIIAGYRYALTYYIMMDNPEMPVKEAMKESCKLMYGNKARLLGYSLILSLLGLAACLPLCLGLIWFIPWTMAFVANFYRSLAADI